MNITGLRVVLDTNVLITIIGKKSPFRWIFDQLLVGKIILCVSNDILLEYQEILAQKVGKEVADNFINFLTAHPFVERVNIFYHFRLISEDEDDNKFVDCAIAGNAVYLVSNDKHFQVLKYIEFPRVNLLTLPEFVYQFS